MRTTMESHLDECALCRECYTQLVDIYGRRHVESGEGA
jgi:hypothetical protein